MGDIISTPFEAEMNPAEVQAMIDASLSKEFFRIPFDHWAAATTAWGGLRSTGFSQQMRGGNQTYIQIPAWASVDKIYEVCAKKVVWPFFEGEVAGGYVDHEIKVRMIFNAHGSSTLLGEAFQGIEIGSFGFGPPWQVNYTGGGGPCIQLRWNYATSPRRWEVCIWDGDTGLAPEITLCNPNPPLTVDTFYRLVELHYTPNANGNLRNVKAKIDGQIVASITGGRLAGLTDSEALWGYFVTSGSSGSSQIFDAGFIGGDALIKRPWPGI